MYQEMGNWERYQVLVIETEVLCMERGFLLILKRDDGHPWCVCVRCSTCVQR